MKASLRKLEIKLVPLDCFGKSPRKFLSRSEWRKIRKKILDEHNYTCEYCGIVYPNIMLCAHEDYEISNNTLNLVGIRCTCENCHGVIHMGRSHILGKGQIAINWMMSVTGYTKDYIIDKFNQELGKQTSEIISHINAAWLCENFYNVMSEKSMDFFKKSYKVKA